MREKQWHGNGTTRDIGNLDFGLEIPSTEIAIVSLYDVESHKVWSGTPYHVLSHLRHRPNIILHTFAPLIRGVPANAQEKFHYYATRREKYLWTRDLQWCQMGAQLANAQLRFQSSSTRVLVFNPADAAFLETSSPVYILLDATWKQFVESYRPFEPFRICDETLHDGAVGESLGFSRASTLLCMTPWAADGVAREYPMHSGKIKVLLPGANLTKAPTRADVFKYIDNKITRQQHSLLFVGAAPYRKGIDVAAKICAYLRAQKLDVILQVAGFEFPSSTQALPFIRSFGFLDKDNINHTQTIHNLFSDSDIFIFPTRAECAGIVLCEAAAYGLPAVVSGSGGTADLIVHGETGFIVGEKSDYSHYVSILSRLFTDKKQYCEIAYRARNRFESSLNWDVFVDEMLSS